jgi:hypothetical protein
MSIIFQSRKTPIQVKLKHIFLLLLIEDRKPKRKKSTWNGKREQNLSGKAKVGDR